MRREAATSRRLTMIGNILATGEGTSSTFERRVRRPRNGRELVRGWKLGSAPTKDSLSKANFWVLTTDGLIRAADADGTLHDIGGRPDQLDVTDRVRGDFALWVDRRLAELSQQGPGYRGADPG